MKSVEWCGLIFGKATSSWFKSILGGIGGESDELRKFLDGIDAIGGDSIDLCKCSDGIDAVDGSSNDLRKFIVGLEVVDGDLNDLRKCFNDLREFVVGLGWFGIVFGASASWYCQLMQ